MNSKDKLDSLSYFHAKPNNWNCAQSIQKGFQDYTGLTDQEIEEKFRTKGGGRAEGGICGALYSAEQILEAKGILSSSIREDFLKKAGSTTCLQLKQELHFPCSSCVLLAEELLAEKLNNYKPQE